MEPNELPFYYIENIGFLGYMKAILLGKSRDVRWIDYIEEGEVERATGDYTATISNKAFLLTVFSESQNRRVPVIVMKWERIDNTDRDQMTNAIFGNMPVPDPPIDYVDSTGKRWRYWRNGTVIAHNQDGAEDTKIHLR